MINFADDYIEIKHFNEYKHTSEKEINQLKIELKLIQDSSKNDHTQLTLKEGNFQKIEGDYYKLKQTSKKQALIIGKNKEKLKGLEEENTILLEEYKKLKALVKNGAPSPANMKAFGLRDRTSVFRDPSVINKDERNTFDFHLNDNNGLEEINEDSNLQDIKEDNNSDHSSQYADNNEFQELEVGNTQNLDSGLEIAIDDYDQGVVSPYNGS